MLPKKRNPLFRMPARRLNQSDNRAEGFSICIYEGGVRLMKGQRIRIPFIKEGLIPSSPYIMASVDKWEVRAFANPHSEVRFLPLAMSMNNRDKKDHCHSASNRFRGYGLLYSKPSFCLIYRHFTGLSREILQKMTPSRYEVDKIRRVGTAMESGITDHIWTWEELLNLNHGETNGKEI